MPRVKGPQTLRTTCLEFFSNIVLQIKRLKFVGASDDVTGLLAKSTEKLLSILPATILEDILEMYVSKYPSGIDSFFPLEIFINFRTSRLNLRFPEFMYSPSDPDVILKKIGSIGASLIDLKLSGVILRNTDCFVNYSLCHLSNITHLTLLCLQLKDCVPITIGKCCKVIEDVTLSGWGLTDIGLTGLVPKVTQVLKRIKLEYDKYHIPKITKRSVFHVLCYAPNLEGIIVPYLKEALEMYDESTNRAPLKLSVCEFNEEQPYSLGPFSPRYSECLLRVCPYISELSLVVCEPQALLLLSQLKCLTTLRVTAENAYHDNYICLFNDGVSELLKNVGRNILNLEFNIPELDFTVIDSYCPELRKLECIDFQTVNRSMPVKKEPFKNLKSLKIFPSDENCLTSQDLCHLLCCCNKLQLLYMSNCDNFNDLTLMKILCSNPLRNISVVEFVDLSKITVHSLRELVLADNDLTQLHIFSCDGVLGFDVEILRNAVKQRFFDLNIKFHL